MPQGEFTAFLRVGVQACSENADDYLGGVVPKTWPQGLALPSTRALKEIGMKLGFAVLLTAALSLSACGESSPRGPEGTEPSAAPEVAANTAPSPSGPEGAEPSAAPEAAASASPKGNLCAQVRPLLPKLAQSLYAMDSNNQSAISAATDNAGDTLMTLHAALEADGQHDLAVKTREAVAEIDALPKDGGTDAVLQRLKWAIGPSSVHDKLVDQCQQPKRDAAKERRDDFLEGSESQ